jgi:hypothetical protein
MNSPLHCTPENVLEALVGQDSSELHMQIVSCIAAFGLGVLFVLTFLHCWCSQLETALRCGSMPGNCRF